MKPPFQIMGILNLTPDSFFDGGVHYHPNQPQIALQQIATMLAEGANIIDIGGESSRPNSQALSVEEEKDRVLPIIKQAVKEFPQAHFSIDTYKPEVAAAALDLGVRTINDINGLRNIKMVELLKRYPCEAVMMHMQGAPQTMQQNPTYENVVLDVIDFFQDQLRMLNECDIDLSRIIIDPGIGFGKTVEHNLQLIANVDQLVNLGQRVLVGASRKSFIGKILNQISPQDRLEGSLAVAEYAYQHGASIFRVHDVAATHRVLTTVDAIAQEKSFPTAL